VSIINYYPAPSTTLAITISGRYAYLEDVNDFSIFDISNPTPTLVGSYSFAFNSAEGIDVVGQYAYVAGTQGLTVFDVSNPSAPTLIGDFNSCYVNNSSFGQSAISGNTVFLPIEGVGLDVIDVSNPTNPSAMTLYSGNIVSIAIAGNYAYAGDWGSHQIDILDISNPANPLLVGTYSRLGLPLKMEIVGSHAYIADAMNGLNILNIADPTHPTFFGGYAVGAGQYTDVKIVGTLAFVDDYYKGQLIELDISDPAASKLVSTIDVGTVATAFDISGGQYYLAGSLLEVVGPNQSPAITQLPAIVDVLNLGVGESNEISVSGNYAYVADLFGGLQIVDASNPSNLLKIGSLSYDSYNQQLTAGSDTTYPVDTLGVHVVGSYAYLLDGAFRP
jgi:hypothetical protein